VTGPDRLAVYGTLVPGESNEGVLAEVAGEWTAGTVVGTRYDNGWHGYPGVVLGGTGRVPVQVLHAPRLTDHLPRLDEFEGPGYRRTVASVRLGDGDEVDAWIYVLVRAPG
jgi:gamma-glutamylcyclotransferase (GGCT)/AIG2-like uncharacterized protein YtfP